MKLPIIKPRIRVARRSFFLAIRFRSFSASLNKKKKYYINITYDINIYIFESMDRIFTYKAEVSIRVLIITRVEINVNSLSLIEFLCENK